MKVSAGTKMFLLVVAMVGVSYYFVTSTVGESQDRQDLALCKVDNEERQAINVQYKAAQRAFARTEQALRTLSHEVKSPKADRQLLVSADDLAALRDQMQLLDLVDCEQLVYNT